MKRVFLYLAAVVATLITVGGAAYIMSIAGPTKLAADKWGYTAGNLDDISRTKDEGSRLAARYAEIATQEQQHDIARLLRAIATAEAIQCEKCRKAARAFDKSDYNDKHQRQILSPKGSSHANILHIIDRKADYHTSFLAPYTHRAMQQGNRYVARLMVWCSASDISQIRLLQRAIINLDVRPTTEYIYYVCPTCSNVSDNEFTCHLCPNCMTSKEEFIIFD